MPGSPRGAGAGPGSSTRTARCSRELVTEPGRARHVVAMLLDGTNPNVLYDLAGRGQAPNVARLMEQGSTYRYGAMASLPTVTLANHTAILTGSHPGHHGILHNAWVDRSTGAQVVTNSPSTWPHAMQWLLPVGRDRAPRRAPRPTGSGVDLDQRALRLGCRLLGLRADAGRRGRRPSAPGRGAPRHHGTIRAPEQGLPVVLAHRPHRRRPVLRDLERRAPRQVLAAADFSWVNFTLTDSAFHEGGPYSEIAAASVRDTDARIGHLLDAVERSGAWEDTAFVLVADHGMELADPGVTGDWDVALGEAGVSVRDEGYGFLYLAEGVTRS